MYRKLDMRGSDKRGAQDEKEMTMGWGYVMPHIESHFRKR